MNRSWQYARTIGKRPDAKDNPYNAWAWKSTIAGAPKGILAGKKIAGEGQRLRGWLPLMNGSRVLENYVPEVDATVVRRMGRALDMLGNTSPFDASGHPGMSVPCGMEKGLPVGLMLIARRYDEAKALRAAAAFEKVGDWRKM